MVFILMDICSEEIETDLFRGKSTNDFMHSPYWRPLSPWMTLHVELAQANNACHIMTRQAQRVLTGQDELTNVHTRPKKSLGLYFPQLWSLVLKMGCLALRVPRHLRKGSSFHSFNPKRHQLIPRPPCSNLTPLQQSIKVPEQRFDALQNIFLA